MPHTRQPVTITSAALALLTAALWGGTPVAISFSVDTLPPIAVAGVRFALGAIFMLFWCRFEGTSLALRTGQFRPCLGAGVLLFLQISLFNVGVTWSNASHGSMLINTFVFWVVAIEHFVTRTDRLTRRKVLGLVAAGAGVALILWVTSGTAAPAEAAPSIDEAITSSLDAEHAPSSPDAPHPSASRLPTLAGDALLLVSALLLGVKIVYIKQALKTVEPGKLILWHDIFGVMLFFAWSGATEKVTLGAFTTTAVLALLYQGVIVAGLCFAIQALLLRKHTASQISVYSFATPLCGVALGVLMRGEPMSPWLLVSAACVAVGIYLVNTEPAQPRSTETVAAP